MSVKTKRAVWLGSAVSVAFAGFATIAWADDGALSGVKVTQGVQTAQAETPPPAQDEQAPPPAETTDDKKVERVVVTGSRLRRSEFTSSSPIQVITREETTLEGLSDTAEILQGSGIASGAQQINNTFGGFVTDGGLGANTVGCRGLDAKRTLILVNGRRLQPSGTRGALGSPDLNTIPESIVDRYEILKDGGSTVYGSDAVACVINVITRQNYDGLQMSGYGNFSEHGGAEQYQANALWGDTFDRGQFMIGVEYYRREALRVGDREYLSCAQDRVQDVATGAILDVIDPATGVSKCWNMLEGVVDNLSFGGRFIPDTAAVFGGGPFSPLYPDENGWRRVGLSWTQVRTAGGTEADWRLTQADLPYNDPRFQSTTIISPATRYAAFAQGSYDLFPGVEAYTELQFTRRESEQERWRQLFPVVSFLYPGSPFLGYDRPVIQIPTNGEQTVDFYRAVGGVKGEFGDSFPIFGNWSYDLYIQHQRSEGDYTGDIIYNDRVLAATDWNDTGLACDQSLITISGGNCADIPTGIRWFDPDVVSNGAFNAQESAFLFGRETGHTTYSQTLINGVVTGDVFQLPAGTLTGALGFEVRTDEIDDTPGFNARNNNLWGSTSAGRTAGSDTVREVFAETNIPILAGKSFAEDLNVDASWRYTSYDSYGEDTTYKLGVNWQVTSEYRLRGTTGTSFRAPALFELFLANQSGFLSQLSVDPCYNWDSSGDPVVLAACGPGGLNLPPGYPTGTTSSALILTGGGGPGVLAAETSESRTVGFIWTPDWIDLSIAVDYWELEVDNEVGQFGAANIIYQCLKNGAADPFCTLFTRDTDPLSPRFGQILEVNNSFVNIANEVTDGLDVTARYEHEFSFGTFRFNGDFNWIFTREVRSIPDPAGGPYTAARDDNGEVYYPDFVAELNFRFDHQDWTFFWDVDMAARQSNDEDFGGSVFGWRGCCSVPPGTPAYSAYYKQYGEFQATHDASVRYIMDDWSFQVGVQNIFDDPPPAVSVSGAFGKVGNSIAVGSPSYDLIGRRGFFRVTKQF